MKPFKYLLLGLTAILLLAGCSDESSVVTEPIEDTYIFPAPHEIDNIPHHTFKMGALFSYQGELRSGKIQQSDGTATEIYYNKPCLTPMPPLTLPITRENGGMTW